MTNPADIRVRLARQLTGVTTDADLDIAVVVDDEEPLTVRLDASGAALVEVGDPERMVTLHVTRQGAERVLAGEANAQMLLESGDLKVGGRIDVLQANASALGALGS